MNISFLFGFFVFEQNTIIYFIILNHFVLTENIFFLILAKRQVKEKRCIREVQKIKKNKMI